MIQLESRAEEGEEGYKKVVLGGTFTQLHKGHKILLRKAYEISNNIKIGLVEDSVVKNKIFSNLIESFDLRKKSIIKYFKKIKNDEVNLEIVPIQDPYGPSIVDKSLTDIVVTEETLPRAVEINMIRLKKGLQPLKIHTIGLIKAKDGRYIRSSRIRCGEIDREGNVLAEIVRINYKNG
jgi:pantetheine-phosphate adenylyltransferase